MPRSTSPEPERDLDRWLSDAARVERERPGPDPDRFVAELDARLDGQRSSDALGSTAPVMQRVPAKQRVLVERGARASSAAWIMGSLAASAALGLALFLAFRSPPIGADHSFGAGDYAVDPGQPASESARDATEFRPAESHELSGGDRFALANLDVLERLDALLATGAIPTDDSESPTELELLEICEALDTLQETEFDQLLETLLEENG